MSIRIGTCSWADESLSKLWYPPGVKSAEDRLRHYAQHFDTVEVNSSYYALPAASMRLSLPVGNSEGADTTQHRAYDIVAGKLGDGEHDATDGIAGGHRGGGAHR